MIENSTGAIILLEVKDEDSQVTIALE